MKKEGWKDNDKKEMREETVEKSKKKKMFLYFKFEGKLTVISNP